MLMSKAYQQNESQTGPDLLGFVRDTCLASFDSAARERLKTADYFPSPADIQQCGECTEPLDEASDEIMKCNVCNQRFCLYCWGEHKHE
jgi:hypothetical protein